MTRSGPSRRTGEPGGAARIIRLVLAGSFFLLVLAVSMQVSVAGVFRGSSPQLALTWAPYDAQARARLAVSLMENRESEEARKRAVALAHEAVRRDPITPVALRALAMPASAAGQRERSNALALMTAAQRLSRRDQGTQIWLIEHNLLEGRPEAAMQHFDIALRTSWSSQQVLFPLLQNALAEPQLFDALVERLRMNPVWRSPFLTYAVDQRSNARETARLAREFLDPSDPEDFAVIRTHLAQLASGGEYALAWDGYVRFGLAPGDDEARRSLKNGGFERTTGVQPFSWWFAEEADLWATPQPDPQGNGTVLEVAAISGRTGVVARQLVRLAPGSYRVRAEFGDVPVERFERPELRIDCASRSGGRALLRLRSTTSGAPRRASEQGFVIPDGCPFQWVSLAVAGDDTEGGPLPWVDNIQLTRISGRS